MFPITLGSRLVQFEPLYFVGRSCGKTLKCVVNLVPLAIRFRKRNHTLFYDFEITLVSRPTYTGPSPGTCICVSLQQLNPRAPPNLVLINQKDRRSCIDAMQVSKGGLPLDMTTGIVGFTWISKFSPQWFSWVFAIFLSSFLSVANTQLNHWRRSHGNWRPRF